MNPYSFEKVPSDISKEIALKHRSIRKNIKLSQADLSARSGVSLGSIKRFEQTGKISFESLLKLAHVLGYLNDFSKIFSSQSGIEKVAKLFSNKTRS